MVKHLASWLRGCPRNTHIGDLWFRTALPCLCFLEKALKMLDRCLQLASSPEERCVEFLVYDMSVFITCENCIFLSSSSSLHFLFLSSLPNFLVFLSSSSSYFFSLFLLFFPVSSSSFYLSPPPPPTPLLLLFISPAILVTCVKQYSTCDLST